MNPSFELLRQWLKRPALFESPVVDHIWNDPWIAMKMLEMQKNDSSNLVSRNRGFTEKSVAWMKQSLELPQGSRICDLGCGAGLYTETFAKQGFQASGVDISARAIGYASHRDYAREYGILYYCCDYLEEIPGGPYDLMTLMYYDFCSFRPEQRRRLLQNIRKALSEGGILILDVFSRTHFSSLTETISLNYSEGGGLWTPLPHYNLKLLFTFPDEKVYVDKNVIITTDDVKEYYSWYSCFGPDDITGELKATGFKVRSLFSDVAGNQYSPGTFEIAIMAETQ